MAIQQVATCQGTSLISLKLCIKKSQSLLVGLGSLSVTSAVGLVKAGNYPIQQTLGQSDALSHIAITAHLRSLIYVKDWV